jgi:hypothetical protein
MYEEMRKLFPINKEDLVIYVHYTQCITISTEQIEKTDWRDCPSNRTTNNLHDIHTKYILHLVPRDMYWRVRPVAAPICTDKKENQIFLIYREIQSGAVAKSYMTNGLLIYGKYFRISSRKPFLIHDFATAPLWISLYMRNFFFFYQCAIMDHEANIRGGGRNRSRRL